MSGLSKEKFASLFDIAEAQDGYFTARQAIIAGYSDRLQSYHVKNADWDREWRGIYRLKHFKDRIDDYMVWYLWSSNRLGQPLGVYSHETALEMHQLSTWTSGKIHMTVPKRFRRSADIPKCLELHHADIIPEFVTMKQRVAVTTPLKTLLDLLVVNRIPRHHLLEAMQQCVNNGTIYRNDILEASLEKHERRLLLDCYESSRKFQSVT